MLGQPLRNLVSSRGWDRKYREIKDRDEEGNVVIRQEEVSRTRVKVERTSFQITLPWRWLFRCRIEAQFQARHW